MRPRQPRRDAGEDRADAVHQSEVEIQGWANALTISLKRS